MPCASQVLNLLAQGGNLPIGSALPFQATASPLELNSRFDRCWLKTVAASRT
jgi:hypothetical protein